MVWLGVSYVLWGQWIIIFHLKWESFWGHSFRQKQNHPPSNLRQHENKYFHSTNSKFLDSGYNYGSSLWLFTNGPLSGTNIFWTISDSVFVNTLFRCFRILFILGTVLVYFDSFFAVWHRFIFQFWSILSDIGNFLPFLVHILNDCDQLLVYFWSYFSFLIHILSCFAFLIHLI